MFLIGSRPGRMRRARFSITWSATAVMLSSAAHPAAACITLAPFHVEDIQQADVVFSGTLTRYQVVKPLDKYAPSYALLTFHVNDILKGRPARNLQVYWSNSTFGIPADLSYTKPFLVAAVKSGRPSLPIRSGSATIYPISRPDLLQVLQAPCSSAFLLQKTPQTMKDIRILLGGGTVEPRDYPFVLSAIFDERERAARTKARSAHRDD